MAYSFDDAIKKPISYLPKRNLKPIPKLDKKLEFKFALKEKLFPLVTEGVEPV
jgi:hypothetical protein